MADWKRKTDWERQGQQLRLSARTNETHHDERSHRLGRLGEGVLESGDACQDLGHGDEDEGRRLHPHGEVDKGHLVAGGSESSAS